VKLHGGNLVTLYVFSGLPGVGKTVLSQRLAARLSAAHLRIDTIEQVLLDLCGVDVQGEGYGLAYRIAADNLRSGVSVVADSCNPIELTRLEWENVAVESGAQSVNIEIICSDKVEHRKRVERRVSTAACQRPPTWEEVENREYHAWVRDRIVIDTATNSEAECLDMLLGELSRHQAQRSG